MNNIIYRTLNTLNIPAILEPPPGISRSDGRKADGLTIMPWIKGKSLLWDATCTDTFCPSNINSTIRVAGSATEKAVRRKKYIYREMISNFHFVAFATETMGPWCEEGKELIEKLGSMLIKKTGDPKSKKYLKERISMAIQRGNAASILNTLPENKGLDEVFCLVFIIDSLFYFLLQLYAH